MNKKVEQGIQTLARLLDVAETIFRERGYAATTTQQIIDQAGVTKGALYHHFKSKQQLFEAVYRRMEMTMGEHIQGASSRQTEPFEQLVAGCNAYLEYCSGADYHRILRLDGPAALGMSQWHAIDREFGVARLLPFLLDLQQAGVLSVTHVEAFAYQLTGAMNEATFWIAQHSNRPRALRESKQSLRALLEGVRGESR